MCERALSRVTQGETLARKQLVQAMIADSWIQIEQFRLLVLRTAWRIDKWDDYQRVRADISAVKAAMPKVLHDVASRALQIHGSLGVSHEMPFASMVLESFHMGLADGATEVHQITLARELLKGYTPTPDLFPSRHLPKLKAEAEARFADVLAERRSHLSPRHAMVSTVVDIIRTHGDARHVRRSSSRSSEISYRTLHARSSRAAQAMRAAGVVAGGSSRVPRQEPPGVLRAALRGGQAQRRLRLRQLATRPARSHTSSTDARGGGPVRRRGSRRARRADRSSCCPAPASSPSTATSAGPTYETWIGRQPADDPGVPADERRHRPAALHVGHDRYSRRARCSATATSSRWSARAAPVWGFHRGMVSIGVSPLFHIAGTGWNLMVMGFGGTVVLHREVDGEAILRDIGRYRVTHAILVPAILQLILARRNEGTADPSSLETVVYGASPISDRVLLELFDAFDCKFMQGYGLTETSGAVTDAARRGSRPVAARAAALVRPAVARRRAAHRRSRDGRRSRGRRRRRGVDPQRSGDDRATGGNPAATAEAIDADGWFRSGDAGYVRDGRLYLHDRVKDMIVSGRREHLPGGGRERR